MIQESQIDQAIAYLEEVDFDKEQKKFSENCPILYGYLLNEQFELLSEEEYMILWFDALAILKCFEYNGLDCSGGQAEDLEKFESDNWAKLENSKPAAFNQKIDVFFEQSPEEELMAFVEDSLTDDEDFQISSAAREILFISLVSIIEWLHAQTEEGQD